MKHALPKTLTLAAVLAACAAVPAVLAQQEPAAPNQGTAMPAQKQYQSAPEMTIDPSKQYTATMKTSQGAMTIELYAKDAPKTVNNFVTLAKDGFYDGVTFHRVIEGFMLQGGDPTRHRPGRAGLHVRGRDPAANPNKHDAAGVLSMANAGPNTNGSQFFVTLAPTPHLNGKHTVFGKVTDGLDVVKKIGSVPTDANDKPRTPVTIEGVTIDEK